MNSYTKLFRKFNGIRSFSTLIVPEIGLNGKLHVNYQTLLKAGSQLSSPLKVILYGSKVGEDQIKAASHFVDEVFVVEKENFDNPTSEELSDIIKHLHNTNKFSNIIASSNNFGKNLIPRVAGLLGLEPIAEVSKILGNNSFERNIYAGNAVATVKNSQELNLMTIRLTSFDKQELNKPTSPKITNVTGINFSRSAVHIENIVSKSDKPELGSASVVISGGRAIKSSENFKLLDELATCFKGAAIGASRAAVDAGYCGNDLQVGQTGKTVAPNLYVAIGISGAIQHIAGMKDSKVIVAINTDPEAPIFNVSTAIKFYTFR